MLNNLPEVLQLKWGNDCFRSLALTEAKNKMTNTRDREEMLRANWIEKGL